MIATVSGLGAAYVPGTEFPATPTYCAAELSVFSISVSVR